MPSRTGRHYLVAVVGLALVTTLLALGSWQLQRRAWKLALIDRVETRVHAAVVAAPAQADWAKVSAARDEYRHVLVAGTWLPARSAWVTATTELGSGYWLLTPLRQADDSVVWINRGFMAAADRARWQPGPDTAARVTGLLRLSETGPRWLRHNDPAAERWYARDVHALSAQRGLAPTAPYFIDADATPAHPGEPVGGLTVLSFPNNHLLYALTWYALALLATAGTVAFWRATPPQPVENDDNS